LRPPHAGTGAPPAPVRRTTLPLQGCSVPIERRQAAARGLKRGHP